MAKTLICSSENTQVAATALHNGHLVAFPTETVYGLGADANNLEAINGIYTAKARPKNHPLIVHISSVELLKYWAIDVPSYATKLASTFWPGPMTLVLLKSQNANHAITGGQTNIGIRVPNNSCATELLQAFEKEGGKGVVAPSANRYGAVSPTSAKDVEEELGKFLSAQDLILDGGGANVGIESTIIECINSKPRLLRPGLITPSMIQTIIELDETNVGGKIETRFSGSATSHYTPKTPVYINQQAQEGDGLIALANINTPDGVTRLCSPSSYQEFATQLYMSFRKADRLNLRSIIVIIQDDNEIAFAIKDRVNRALSEKKFH
jgi:L-threonylcarbamoyladenylate synthase